MQNRLTNDALIERFNHIMEWAEPLSAVKIHTGAKMEEMYSVRNIALRTIEPIVENELTQFMVAPILEHFFTMIRPAINIPVEELMAGNNDKLNECAEFTADLAAHPVRHQWAAKSEIFRQIAESAGYKFERSDYQDLAFIAPIVADALTTFDNSKYSRTVYKLRSGNFSGANPILLDEIHVFNDIADAVHIYEKIPVPAFIGFFGVEKTYGMSNNDFDDWRHGRNARKNNVMKNGMTEEEYAAQIDTYSRTVYCMVRDGENFWVFIPPINTSHHECMGDDGSFINWYGHRATYAPIQIFWSRFATVDTTSTALVPYKPRKWSMREILDEDQKVWLPIFFNTVKNHFFGEVEVNAKKAIIISETNVVLQLPNDTKNTNLPAVVQNRIQLPDMEDLFNREEVIDENGLQRSFVGEREKICYRGALPLMKWMGITAADIADAPIGFFDMKPEQDAIKELEEHTVAAYYKVIRDRLPGFWAPHAAEAHKWFRDWMDKNHSQVVEDIRTGRIPAEIHVHKKLLFNPDGTPKMYKPRSWEEKWVQETDSTDIDLGKIQPGRVAHMHAYQWFSAPTLIDKRAPVTVSIHMNTPEQLAELMNTTVESLPMPIQMMRFANAFCDRYAKININAHFLYNKSDFKKDFPNYV